MKKPEYDKLVADTLEPYGVTHYYSEEGGKPYLVWAHEDKETKLRCPRSTSTREDVLNFIRDLKRQIRKANLLKLDPDENKVHLTNRIRDVEYAQGAILERMDACEEMLLDGLAKLQEGLAKMNSVISPILAWKMPALEVQLPLHSGPRFILIGMNEILMALCPCLAQINRSKLLGGAEYQSGPR